MKHGYKFHFENNKCIICDKGQRSVVRKIEMEKTKSFPIVFKYAENVLLRAEIVEETWLWHRRFEHLYFNSLKLLCQKKLAQ